MNQYVSKNNNTLVSLLVTMVLKVQEVWSHLNFFLEFSGHLNNFFFFLLLLLLYCVLYIATAYYICVSSFFLFNGTILHQQSRL